MSKSKPSSISSKQIHMKGKEGAIDINIDMNIGGGNNIELQITSIESLSSSKPEKTGGKGVIALSRLNKKQSKTEAGNKKDESGACALVTTKPVIKDHDVETESSKKIRNTLDVIDKSGQIPYIETPWTIIGAYFQNQHLKRLVRHQIESYNDFVNNQIQKTIEMFNPVLVASEHDYCKKSRKNKLEMEITFDKFNLYRPQIHENNGATKIMFPHDARSRNFTYASTMTIDINIRYVIRTGENLENTQTHYKSIPKVHIGKLPIMLKSSICVLNQYTHINNNVSGECKHDAGGYFIINGSEKTVLGQERAAESGAVAKDLAGGGGQSLHARRQQSVDAVGQAAADDVDPRGTPASGHETVARDVAALDGPAHGVGRKQRRTFRALGQRRQAAADIVIQVVVGDIEEVSRHREGVGLFQWSDVATGDRKELLKGRRQLEL